MRSCKHFAMQHSLHIDFLFYYKRGYLLNKPTKHLNMDTFVVKLPAENHKVQLSRLLYISLFVQRNLYIVLFLRFALIAGQLHCNTQACDQLSEQVDRLTGHPTSASDLTWSSVAVLRAWQVEEKSAAEFSQS